MGSNTASKNMKTKNITVMLALALTIATTPQCFASGPSTTTDPAYVAWDILVVRPVCFAFTVAGSALFVISLPVAATSKSVHQVAHTLVVRPAKATFTRPIGNM